MTNQQAGAEQVDPTNVQEAIAQLDYEVNNLYATLDALDLRLTRPADEVPGSSGLEVAPVTLLDRSQTHTNKLRQCVNRVSNIEKYLGV